MSNITIPEDFIPTEADSGELAGTDGNAFSIMAFVSKQLRRAGNDQAVIDSYRKQAQSGDYDNLLAVSMAFLDA